MLYQPYLHMHTVLALVCNQIDASVWSIYKCMNDHSRRFHKLSLPLFTVFVAELLFLFVVFLLIFIRENLFYLFRCCLIRDLNLQLTES